MTREGQPVSALPALGASALLAPTPVLTALRSAAPHCGDGAMRLFRVIEAGYPSSLERRPAQLLSEAQASAEDLDRLVAGAGFVDTDELRLRAVAEVDRRLAVPDLLFTQRDEDETSRQPLRPILRREQENLADTLQLLQANGSLELAARAVLGGSRRWVLGDMKSTGYAALLFSDLTLTLNRVSLIQPSSASVISALCDVHSTDVLVAYSFPRYSKLTLAAAKGFREAGATVVALTDNLTSPICAYAQHILPIHTNSPARAHSPTTVVCVGHLLASIATAGAKGATRRTQRREKFGTLVDCYELDDRSTKLPAHA